MELIADLLDILAQAGAHHAIIARRACRTSSEQFGDKRRSEIVAQREDLSIEDLIAPEDMVVTFSHGGYVKSQPLADYRAQRRGGRGKQATATKEDDFIERMFVAHTHDYILCFSNRGRVYWLKVYEVPQGGTQLARQADREPVPARRGREDHRDPCRSRSSTKDHFVFMATAHGTVKKTPLSDFSRPRPSGIIAVDLDEGDYLIGVALTDGKHDVMLFSLRRQGGPLRRGRRAPDGPHRARRARHDCSTRASTVISLLVAEDEIADGADRDRERLRQAHADRRVHPSRPRHPGHDRDPDSRSATARSLRRALVRPTTR